MKPINDLIKVKVSEDDGFGFGGDESEGVQSGILVEIPEVLPYFGFRSFAFDGSLADPELTEELLAYYRPLVGKRVYWTAYSERGSVIKEGDETFAYVKFTDLIAVGEPDGEGESVDIKDGGAFKL